MTPKRQHHSTTYLQVDMIARHVLIFHLTILFNEKIWTVQLSNQRMRRREGPIWSRFESFWWRTKQPKQLQLHSSQTKNEKLRSGCKPRDRLQSSWFARSSWRCCWSSFSWRSPLKWRSASAFCCCAHWQSDRCEGRSRMLPSVSQIPLWRISWCTSLSSEDLGHLHSTRESPKIKCPHSKLNLW